MTRTIQTQVRSWDFSYRDFLRSGVVSSSLSPCHRVPNASVDRGLGALLRCIEIFMLSNHQAPLKVTNRLYRGSWRLQEVWYHSLGKQLQTNHLPSAQIRKYHQQPLT